MMRSLSEFLDTVRLELESTLEDLLSQDVYDAHLHEAMQYACLNGGKRLRAALLIAAAQLNPHYNHADARYLASAVEMIHAYSLVHDDMPCMDDDDLRRGKPTVHKRYDEATAMLVGDALQAKAFQVLSQTSLSAPMMVRALKSLSSAALEMVEGQSIDVYHVGKQLDLPQLQAMHKLKTGAMIRVSVLLGGMVAGVSEDIMTRLDHYAQALGLAFQVVDDILDVTVSTEELGKTAGKDQAQAKPTYVSMLGMSEAQAFTQSLYEQAVKSIKPIARNEALLGLAQMVIQRRS